MIIIDTNVLVYAANTRAAQNERTTAWIDRMLAEAQVFGLPWVVALGFIRITTNPRVFAEPLTPDEALTAIQSWQAHPAVTVPAPTGRHLSVLSGLLREAGTAGNLTTDAHIAALAIEHGASVASFDRDLARFGVTVVVPD